MRYLTVMFSIFLTVLVAIASFNWFIDPFAMYWSPQVDGINSVKPEAEKRSRISKAYRIEDVHPQILIVGNSRVEMGLDPNNAVFKGQRVYNQGIPGATIRMQVDYAINAINTEPELTSILMSVDFLDFLLNDNDIDLLKVNDNAINSYDFRLIQPDDNKIFAQFERLKEKASLIFSLDALVASFKTITSQESLVNHINTEGFNSANLYLSILKTEGIIPLFNKKLTSVTQRLTNQSLGIIAQNTYPYSINFQNLGRLITTAHKKNIQVTFFINPYHFSYLHTLAENKQWDNFNVWKKTLVKYFQNNQDNKVTLWDFSLFNSVINEEVPITNPNQQMKWFWEPAHYKKELGNIMLKQMDFQNNQSNIGIKLNQSNIEQVIQQGDEGLINSQAQWEVLKNDIR